MTEPIRSVHRPTARRRLAAALSSGVLLAVAAVVVAASPPAIADDGSPRAEHVVLVGFDGFDPDYMGRVPTPNLDALAARGAGGVTQGVMLPITNPSFTSLTTGAWPDRSGNRAYVWDKGSNTYQGQSRTNSVTSIAEAVVSAGGTVGSAQYFILQGNGTDYGRAGAVYTQPGGTCARKFDDAVSMLRQEPVVSGGTTVPVAEIPTLLAVYCGDLDEVGHDEGAESPNLDARLIELDAQVGRLVATLEEVGIADETTIIVTGDHGMSTYTQSFAITLATEIGAAGYTTQFLFANGQAVSPNADVVLTSTGRSLVLYLAGDLQSDADALAELRSIAESVEGTGTILDRAAQAALHMHPDYGDLVIESEPGWGASILPPTGPQGDHGSSAETDAVFVMAGAGVARAGAPVQVRHVDVAPTIAELLGLPPLPDADGQVLTALLTAPEPPPTSTTTSSSTTSPSSSSSTSSSTTSSTTAAPSTSTTTSTTAAPSSTTTVNTSTVPTSSTTSSPTTTTAAPEQPTTTVVVRPPAPPTPVRPGSAGVAPAAAARPRSGRPAYSG